ncbi:thiamine pyrophosphokinase 2 isoform X2 [Amia ocellicauda]|uniref:thiamine pyrophosphokinase 2 isoform X2 n=1 Tax=Amia ocellicauda TaxID=2972642 RepID=UPI003463D8E8
MSVGSSQAKCCPFMVSGHQVGWVPPRVVTELGRFPEVFQLQRGTVELSPGLESYTQRSAAVDTVLHCLREENTFRCLRGWRDEKYEVMPQFCDPPMLCMERSATCLFGVKRYGVHINGFTRQPDGGVSMWVARRALGKPTYPGLLDNMVAGGLAAQTSITQTLVKECAEEACIPECIAKCAHPVSTVSYTYEDDEGVFPECQFVFDLEVPQGFTPQIGDGEVLEFYLWPMDKVKEALVTAEFKPNCALVVLDFLIRHSYLDPDTEPHYQQFVAGLHRSL